MKVAKITRKLALQWTPEDPKKDPWLRCSTVPGLCLRVRPVKGERWRREIYVSYRWYGKTRFKALGLLEEWGLERGIDEVREARVRVKQAQLRGESDPMRRPESSRNLVTMTELSEVYQKHSTKAADSQKEDARNWGKVLDRELPDGARLGDRGILQVSPADLWAVRKAMEETPVAFNRTLALLSNAFNLAQRYGLLDASDTFGWTNPCRAVEKFPERRRERVFSVEEYRALRLALDALIEENLQLAPTRRHARFKARSLLSLRIMARTAMRPVELRTLTKGEVHWSESFADTRKAKGDRGGSRKGRILAFGPRTLEDLRTMEELSSGSELFMPSWVDNTRPIPKQGTRNAWTEAKTTADERFGTNLTADSEASIYVFRHTVVNRHARAGVDLGDIHDFVGHRSAKAMITHTYRHTDVPRLLEIAQVMEDHMDGLVSDS